MSCCLVVRSRSLRTAQTIWTVFGPVPTDSTIELSGIPGVESSGTEGEQHSQIVIRDLTRKLKREKLKSSQNQIRLLFLVKHVDEVIVEYYVVAFQTKSSLAAKSKVGKSSTWHGMRIAAPTGLCTEVHGIRIDQVKSLETGAKRNVIW